MIPFSRDIFSDHRQILLRRANKRGRRKISERRDSSFTSLFLSRVSLFVFAKFKRKISLRRANWASTYFAIFSKMHAVSRDSQFSDRFSVSSTLYLFFAFRIASHQHVKIIMHHRSRTRDTKIRTAREWRAGKFSLLSARFSYPNRNSFSL